MPVRNQDCFCNDFTFSSWACLFYKNDYCVKNSYWKFRGYKAMPWANNKKIYNNITKPKLCCIQNCVAAKVRYKRGSIYVRRYFGGGIAIDHYEKQSHEPSHRFLEDCSYTSHFLPLISPFLWICTSTVFPHSERTQMMYSSQWMQEANQDQSRFWLPLMSMSGIFLLVHKLNISCVELTKWKVPLCSPAVNCLFWISNILLIIRTVNWICSCTSHQDDDTAYCKK